MAPNPALTRRSLLRSFAAAGTITVASCFGGPEDPQPEPDPSPETEIPEDRFDEVVDLGAAGAPLDGSETITDLVAAIAGDDTLIEFPAGTYAIEPIALSHLTNIGFRAVDGADVTLVPDGPVDELGQILLQLTDVEGLLFDGLTLDFREAGHGGMMYVLGTGSFEIRDLTVLGSYPPDVSGFRFEVVRPDSTGLVKNLVARGGSVDGSESVGIYVGRTHAGELVLEDCEIANFPNNGVYASSPGRQDAFSGGNGPVHVRGGLYENNNIANVRLGSSGSTARNVTVRVDDVPPRHGNGLNPRGIRIRAREGQVIEGCDVSITGDVPNSTGGIVFHSEAGAATVTDTRVHVDTDGVPAVKCLTPNSDGGGITVENVDVTGAAAGGSAVEVEGRDATTVRDCRITQTGQYRSGILFRDATDCAVTDSNLSVTGQPIVTEDADVRMENNVLDGGEDG